MKVKIQTILTIILKSPTLFKLFKVIKLLKFAKPVFTIVSIVISIGAYSIIYNPVLAVGLVVVIFVHEMGHVLAMNKEGFKTSGPVFIPFVGAALFAPKTMDRRQEAVIGIGGPILGSIFSLLLVGLYFLLGYKWLIVMGYFGLFLNLFNMIPITPLDGGRVTQAVGKYFKVIGILMLLVATVALKNPGILLIWIIVLSDLNFLSLKTRFGLALAVELTMIMMLITGFAIADQAVFWATFVDACVGAVWLIMIGTGIVGNAARLEELMDEGSKRPDMIRKDKMKWFLVWFVVTTILLLILMFLEPSMKLIMVG